MRASHQLFDAEDSACPCACTCPFAAILFVFCSEPLLLTCFAQRNPQLLHKSLWPLGPRLHSGVTRVWQFAQSRCGLLAPLRRLRFFLLDKSDASSSERSLLLLSICRSSYCQLVQCVVFNSSKKSSPGEGSGS